MRPVDRHETIDALRTALREARQAGQSVGVVPTMGYLHDGHLELVRRARAENDRVVVTIFVNPTQFGPNEDFSTYPRDMERDLALLDAAKVDAVFTPGVEAMYPQPLQTTISLKPLGDMLIGKVRPGHFSGVATVVAKLFNIVQPTRAYFGEKDFQQLTVIRRMVQDLNFPVEIVGVPTVREADGLAMSSRNVRLSPDDRRAARVLSAALAEGAAMIEAGEGDAARVVAQMTTTIAAEPGVALRSLDICDSRDLSVVERIDRPVVMLVTAEVGPVLLIDQREARPV
ncbi:pantoate--beta-alanine ligase [Jiella pelagia]|uniref:Pantothenate synthetase n=1 Tax=Jiella pelagia TaxID=2986949 RepID=A0ABY7C3H8_9HYPH|nr:pantoate--beta-alanine ligase [Jiella pelagia]WAP69885.1 pantoate--beta-alanine ligase [Jiella pelagia]